VCRQKSYDAILLQVAIARAKQAELVLKNIFFD